MTQTDHGDLDREVDLLQYTLRCAREEIERLRALMRPTEIRFAGEGRLPTRAYGGDAGFDLYVQGEWWVGPGQFVDVDLGVACELPPGVWAMITGRSSTMRARRLLVIQGIIDQGYRGPLYAGVQNLSEDPVSLQDGERIAQMIPFHLVTGEAVRVEELASSERGTNGFGSSGR